jgi:hypothetical protein
MVFTGKSVLFILFISNSVSLQRIAPFLYVVLQMRAISLLQLSKFEIYTRKTFKVTGFDSIRFFTTIRDILNYFWEDDQTLKDTPLTFGEFETTAQKIVGVLGERRSVKVF